MSQSQPKIEITAKATTRKGTGANGDYSIVTQEAYLHQADKKYPEKFLLNLEGENMQYPEGFYEFDMHKSLETGQYDRLGFSRFPVLIPLAK